MEIESSRFVALNLFNTCEEDELFWLVKVISFKIFQLQLNFYSIFSKKIMEWPKNKIS